MDLRVHYAAPGAGEALATCGEQPGVRVSVAPAAVTCAACLATPVIAQARP